MRTWQLSAVSPPLDSALRKAGEATRGSKEKRTEAINERRASDRWERIRVGDTTWVKNWYRRRKEDRKFVGSFRVVRKLTQFRDPPQMTVDVNTVSGLAMTAILNMPKFTGDTERLTDILEAASAAGVHLKSVNTLLPPAVVNNIYGILIRKIPYQVRAAEVTRLLSNRYGGARRQPAKSVVKLLRMKRALGETPSAFMHRVDQAFRLVKARMVVVETAGKASAKLGVIEKLLKEAVLSEMPEKLRRQLKGLSDSNFVVLHAQVDEEEDDYQPIADRRETSVRALLGVREHPPLSPLLPADLQAGLTGDRQSAATGTNRCERCEDPQEEIPGGIAIIRICCLDGELQLRLRILVGRGLACAPTTDATAEPEDSAVRKRGYQCVTTRPRFEGPAKGGPPVGGNRGTAGGLVGKVYQIRSREACAVPCSFVATTVSGPTSLRCEIVLSLEGLSGRKRSVIAHVMDWTSNEYEVILGTDALKCVNGHVQFYREGEPLSATGRVGHEIFIPDNRVVYVKPRRYPQALTEVMEKEVRRLLSQGIVRKFVSLYCSPLWVVPKPPDAQQEHGRHLEQLLQRLKEFGLKASCEKSSFLKRKIHGSYPAP
ncbi:hypothetical protein AAG570_012470 [Ranatra chinensis]|uniref:Reverse transcriptase n=1 Tax=Ranatra chinensis TaxID=642074 RepID=A0ABD0YDY1_9HEMI